MTMAAALVLLVQGTETPDYKHWASCKPGSWVRLRIETKTPEFTLTQEATIRLLKVEKEAATVEVVQRAYSGDDLLSAHTTHKGIPARVEADLDIVKESEETLQIGGRKLGCRRSDVRRAVGGEAYAMSFWTCADVPGGTVKSEGGPVGEKEPSNRMTALEWRKETAVGVEEASTREEAEGILKKVEEVLVNARTLQFGYARTFNGTPAKGRFAREGDRFMFTFTSDRKFESPLTHTRISDGKNLVLRINEKGVGRHDAKPGLGANALAVILYGVPESLDPWENVEEGIPMKSKVELSDVRIRRREADAVVLEMLRVKPGDKFEREHVTLWVDIRRHMPSKRLLVPAREKPVYDSRLEETFGEFRLNESIDPATFVVP